MKITNEMKVNQIKILDIYAEDAKEDATMRKFLVEMASRLNAILHKLDTKENEEPEDVN